MEKETLKDWVKKWTIKNIISNAVSEGMKFQAISPATTYENEGIKELKRNCRIFVKEIESRIK